MISLSFIVLELYENEDAMIQVRRDSAINDLVVIRILESTGA